VKHPSLLSLLLFGPFILVPSPAATQCAGCTHGQFGAVPGCVPATTGACVCQRIGQANICYLCGGCSLGGCVDGHECDDTDINRSTVGHPGAPQIAGAKPAEEPELQSIPKSGTHGRPPTAAQLAMHPWITNASLADSVTVGSKAMGYILRTTQQFLQKRYWINTRGEANTTPASSDENGWIRFELIPRAEGAGDEFRITYETTGAEEKLMLFPTKWFLLKTDSRSGNEEEIARGEVTPQLESPAPTSKP